jgi:hypothetical protein
MSQTPKRSNQKPSGSCEGTAPVIPCKGNEGKTLEESLPAKRQSQDENPAYYPHWQSYVEQARQYRDELSGKKVEAKQEEVKEEVRVKLNRKERRAARFANRELITENPPAEPAVAKPKRKTRNRKSKQRKETDKKEEKTSKNKVRDNQKSPSPVKNKEQGVSLERNKKKGKFVGSCPAIRQWKNRFQKSDHPLSLHTDVHYVIPHSMYYNNRKVEILKEWHPEASLEDLKLSQTYNRHPLCAAFRAIAEAHAITLCMRDFADADVQEGLILDVGGSAQRHHNNGRKYIHSCCPDFEAKDLLRRFKRGGQFCRHMWGECDDECTNQYGLGEYTISISVHSIYYSEPGEILRALLQQAIPIHYAVIHRYTAKDGTIMDGEMSYQRYGDMVVVQAEGNSSDYAHSAMDWLNQGFYQEQGIGTLVWELERTFLDVEVWRFRATARLPDFSRKLRILKMIEEYKNEEEKEVEIKVEEIPEEKAPEDPDVIYEKMCRKHIRATEMMGGKGEKSFISRVRREAAKAGFDDMMIVESYASNFYKTQPVIIKPPHENDLSRAAIRANNLSWQVPARTYWPWVLLLLSWMSGSSYVAYYHWDSIHSIGVTTAIIAVLWLRGRYPLSIRLLDYCCDGYPLRELSRTKTMKLKKPEKVSCVPGTRAYPMVYHPDFVPCIPRNCWHNVNACIQHKVLSDTGLPKSFPTRLPQVLIDLARDVALFLEPICFDSWVGRFPPAKEKKLRQEKDEGEAEADFCKEDWNKSNLFLKSEFYNEQKPPRPIHSARVELNFSTGRWLVPLGELIAAFLPHWILFPIHGDAFEIGEFLAEYQDYVIGKSDFSQYDSTQHNAALLMICEFFEKCGIPKEVVDLMRLDTESISISNRLGFHYVAKGFRLSGRSETLLGNTILTLFLFLIVFKEIVAIVVKGDDAVIFLEESPNNDEEVKQKFTDLGFIAKFETCRFIDMEFCSSYVVPCEEGNVLVPKPGKLLAKTFWCKRTDYTLEEQKDQFAGILKGLRSQISFIPGIRGLYNNPVYTERSKTVKLIRDTYNEYTDIKTTCSDETYQWMEERYGLSRCELDDLEAELAVGYPVKLESVAARVLIETDWGPEGNWELLVENEDEPEEQENRWNLLINVLLEELLRYSLGWSFTVGIGLYESYQNNSCYNVVMHILLQYIALHGGWGLAIVLHLFNNIVRAGPKQLNSLPRNMVRRNKKQAPKRKNKQRRPRNRRRRSQTNEMVYASMISNPCDAILTPGVFSTDEGILTQHKTVFSGGSATTSGFILWDPAHATRYSDDGHFNCIAFATTTPSTRPVNSPATPFGTGSAMGDVEGQALNAGASNFCAAGSASSWRCVGACVRMTYVGAMTDAAGRVGYLENVPADTVLKANGADPVSINELFGMCSKTSRLDLDTMEVTYRPYEGATNFKDREDSAFYSNGSADTIVASDGRRFGSRMMGFVWDSVSDTDELFFEFIQNIEWKPQSEQGLVITVPKQISAPGNYQRVLQYLDNTMPGWSTTLGAAAKSITSRFVKAAWNNYAPGLTHTGLRMIGM